MATPVVRTLEWTLEIVKRSDQLRFTLLPKRWTFKRTLARISRNRRLSRDYESHTREAAAFIRMATIRIMLRRKMVNPS